MKNEMEAKRRIGSVAICLDIRHRASREVVEGVMRHVSAAGGVEVAMFGNHPCNDGFERAVSVEPEVVVADATALRGRGLALLKAPSVRGIVFCGREAPPAMDGAAVLPLVSDAAGIASAAARLLVRCGLKDFAYLGTPMPTAWSEIRWIRFREALAALGFSPIEYGAAARRAGWRRERRRLRKWVEALPKPCGIFAAFDQRACHALAVCREAGLPVPQQVQILGVDDDEYICASETPSLSSVAVDFRDAAERAMSAMAAHLEDGVPLPETVLARVSGVTERRSTYDISRTGERVNLAREFIRLHAAEGISPADVARHVGGTLRLLEGGFRKVLGTTVAHELREARFATVRRLLENTETPLGEIAGRTGFGSAGGLMNAFKARFGVSMRQWRDGSRN